MRQTIKLFLFFLIGVVLLSCESEYSKTVKRELKTGIVHEDLVLGLKLGQTQKEFYNHCWQLNKQKVISAGSGNRFAKHTMLLDSTAQNAEKVDMLFYGIFDQDQVMHGVHLIFSYVKWAPWNKEYHPPVLLKALQQKYLKEYQGNPFIEITIKDDVKAYVKVDGNREILMYPSTDKDVTVKIQDLRFKVNGSRVNQQEEKKVAQKDSTLGLKE